jgi:stress response protein YsnF
VQAKPPADPARPGSSDEQTIPVIREELSIDRRRTDSGAAVRVRKTVEQRAVAVDEPRIEHRVRVERVDLERQVDRVPEPRVEGDVIVVSVVEARLAVERRLFVTQELRISRDAVARHDPQTVVLNVEHAVIERQDEPGGPWRSIDADSVAGPEPRAAAPDEEHTTGHGTTPDSDRNRPETPSKET